MITRTTIVALFALLYINAFTQPKSTLSITVGPSLPIGKFARKDSASILAFGNVANMYNGAGMAKLGYNIAGEYQYRLTKKFGLALKYKWQQNSVNADAEKQYLLTNNSWATVFSVHYSKWTSGSLLVGGYYIAPLKTNGNKLDLQLKLLIGGLKTSVPGSSFFLANPSFFVSSGSEADRSLRIGFSFLTSAGIAYHLNKKFDLLANLEYSDAFPPSLTYYTLINNSGNYLLGNPYKIGLDFSTIGLNIGAGFKF